MQRFFRLSRLMSIKRGQKALPMAGTRRLARGPARLRGAPRKLRGAPQGLRGAPLTLRGAPRTLRGMVVKLRGAHRSPRSVLQRPRGAPGSSPDVVSRLKNWAVGPVDLLRRGRCFVVVNQWARMSLGHRGGQAPYRWETEVDRRQKAASRWQKAEGCWPQAPYCRPQARDRGRGIAMFDPMHHDNLERSIGELEARMKNIRDSL